MRNAYLEPVEHLCGTSIEGYTRVKQERNERAFKQTCVAQTGVEQACVKQANVKQTCV